MKKRPFNFKPGFLDVSKRQDKIMRSLGFTLVAVEGYLAVWQRRIGDPIQNPKRALPGITVKLHFDFKPDYFSAGEIVIRAAIEAHQRLCRSALNRITGQ